MKKSFSKASVVFSLWRNKDEYLSLMKEASFMSTLSSTHLLGLIHVHRINGFSIT